MFIGQFVFNYTDRSGKTWENLGDGLIEHDSENNVFPDDLVITSGKKFWTAVGVQGPVGLTFYINDMLFILGHSGIYEIEDYKITSFRLQNDATQTIIDYKGE